MGRIKKALAVVLTLVMSATILPALKSSDLVGAAQTFTIISPLDNGLMAAGHFDIKWSEALSGTVKEYKVFIDNKEAGTTTNLSYEYYTTDVKMYSAYVTAEYEDGSTETTAEVSFGVTKKGLAVNRDMGQNLNPVDMNMGWYYTWGTDAFSNYQYKKLEFVPMVWGAGNETNEINGIKKNYKYLLAYNEPDMVGNGGSNINVNVAINNWPKFLKGNYYLGSPAPAFSPSWDNGNWFRTFMNSVDTETIDFIPLHCYYGKFGGAAGAESFLESVVDKTYEMYHKPIWVTEFAVSGWGYQNEAARKSLNEFMYTVIDGLNSRPYVERYSWFSFDTTDNYNGASALWTNSTGELTELGYIYSDYGNPEGYVAPKTEEEPYNITSTQRYTAYEDSITLNSVTCHNYIKNDSVTATASSEINNENRADKAIDGDVSTRWESVHGVDPQIFVLDLGIVRDIKQISILWEGASAKDYNIEVSSDGISYIPVAEASGMSGMRNRNDTVLFRNMVSARYIRIIGIERTTAYGYSIYDIGVYGTDDKKVDETSPAETTTRPDMSIKPDIPTVPPKNTTKAPEQSTTVSAKIKVGTTKVKKAVKKKSSVRIKISLKKVKGVKGYQIRIYKSKRAKKVLVKSSTKKIKFTFKSRKIKNKKTLYISARAYKVSKGIKYYGKWSKRKKINVKR